jgi:hypothetical protein
MSNQDINDGVVEIGIGSIAALVRLHFPHDTHLTTSEILEVTRYQVSNLGQSRITAESYLGILDATINELRS